MTEPLSLRLEVACSAEHAFTVWTTRIDAWWPADHTASGRDDAQVVLERYVGGRIYERTPDGTEHDWGEVTQWDPPHRLGYRWHLRRDRADATDVEIRFLAATASSTVVEIQHRGWERLGAEADVWRDRNRTGWSTLLPHFTAAAESAEPDPTH
jgi:uncharacterized protein YndB with AHSA1/START domain